jgi:hypothetical protein
LLIRSSARFFGGVVGFFAVGDLIEQFGHGLADEHRNDGRRRFVGAQAVVVAGVGDAGAQQVGVFIHRHDGVDKKGQEAQVALGRLYPAKAG